MLKPAEPPSTGIDVFYVHADHLGTPRKISRPSDNQVLREWQSEAFGHTPPNQNPTGQGDFVFNFRFPGQYADAETGLHYNYFRDYDPRTGRYIQSDPIGLGGGINTYAYVGNNPLRYTDPQGLFALPLAIPLGQALVDAATVVLGGAMIADSLSSSDNVAGDYSPWFPESGVNDQFVRDRDKVKELDVKPPPYENPNKPKCDEIRERIKRIEGAMQARDHLTNTWYGGVWNAGHAKRQSILQKELDKLQARLNRGDCECP